MKKTRKSRRMVITIPALRAIKGHTNVKSPAEWMVKQMDETNAGEMKVRFVLKNRKYAVCMSVKRL